MLGEISRPRLGWLLLALAMLALLVFSVIEHEWSLTMVFFICVVMSVYALIWGKYAR